MGWTPQLLTQEQKRTGWLSLAIFWHVYAYFERLFVPFYNRQWNLSPPLYSRNQRKLQTMDKQTFSATKEGKSNQRETPHLVKEKMLFHQNHTQVANYNGQNSLFQLVLNSPYFPDLVLSDYYLFANLFIQFWRNRCWK